MITKISKSKAAAVAVSALIAGSAAQAATTLDVAGLKLSHVDSQNAFGFDMTRVVETNGTVQIDLWLANYGLSRDTALAGSGSDSTLTAHQFAGVVKPGYRITSLSLSALVLGMNNVNQPSICADCTLVSPGRAENQGAIAVSVSQGGVTSQSASKEVKNADDLEMVTMTASLTRPIDGSFDLDLRTWSSIIAERSHVVYNSPDGPQDYSWGDAYSYVDTGSFVLTVQVSAVPEPSTYGMLLAGLGVAGCAARRRRA